MSMQSEKLYEGMNYINEEFIDEAAIAPRQTRRTRRGWIKYVAVAACVCVVAAGAIVGGVMTRNAGSSGDSAIGTGGTSVSAGGYSGDGHSEGTTYDSYAGPVFPLTTVEDTSGLVAERTVNWDFTKNTSVADTGEYVPFYNVTDSYVLTNSTDEDIEVTAVYPYAGTFSDTDIPIVTVDGSEVQTSMAFSTYSGGFTSADSDEDGGSIFLNFGDPDSWEDYKSVLSDEEYFETDISDYPELSQEVTVYEITDPEYSGNAKAAAPTLAINVNIDTEKTAIFTYNFNGFTSDYDAGNLQLSFFIPDENSSMYGESYYLIVMGDDIEDYKLEGYKNGACKATEKIKVTYEMDRYETTLGEILEKISRDYYDDITNPDNRAVDDPINDEVTFDMYYGEVCRMVSQYEPISDYSEQRYVGPEIDGIISEPYRLSRVMFRTFSVTIPAGGSAEVVVSQVKDESYDYHCGSDDSGIRGYDMVTTLGSRLEFTAQHASITNYDGIEIVSQNFGFDLERGVTSVELDVDEEHYYMDVRWKED